MFGTGLCTLIWNNICNDNRQEENLQITENNWGPEKCRTFYMSTYYVKVKLLSHFVHRCIQLSCSASGMFAERFIPDCKAITHVIYQQTTRLLPICDDLRWSKRKTFYFRFSLAIIINGFQNNGRYRDLYRLVWFKRADVTWQSVPM